MQQETNENFNDSRLYRYGEPVDSTMHFEMRPNRSFAPKVFNHYGEALDAIKDFGVTDKDSEYFDYWEDQRNQCVVVRVQTVVDVINNSLDSIFEAHGNISAVKKRLLAAKKKPSLREISKEA